MQKTFEPQPVYILDGTRTVFGRRYGSLKRQTVADLASLVIQELLRRTKVPRQMVDEVILGSAVLAGAGQNPARQALWQAGLRHQTPGFTVNSVCGAGLQAAILGSQSIMLEQSHIVIAGGAESASQNPSMTFKPVEKTSPEDLKDSLMTDGLTCSILQQKMGVIMEASVKKYSIARERQDAFTLESQQRGYQAYQKRLDTGEVVTIAATKTKTLDIDESIRKNISASALAALPPVFGESGTLTAGNSSAACDGAAGVILAGAEIVRKHQWKPMARIVGFVHIAVDPEQTFEAPVEAIKACLRKTGISLHSIDLFEISEAFAAEMIFLQDELKIPGEKLNIWGGDLAVGHPLGAAGARTLVTLVHALVDRKLKRGLCAVAYGGGGAIAMILENCRLDAPLFAKK